MTGDGQHDAAIGRHEAALAAGRSPAQAREEAWPAPDDEQDVPALVQRLLLAAYEDTFANGVKDDPTGPAPSDGPTTARIIIEVHAGVIPGQPEPEFTRRWVITGQQWAEATAGGPEQLAQVGKLLAEFAGHAQGYAAWLMMQPDRLNWVRTEWVYL